MLEILKQFAITKTITKFASNLLFKTIIQYEYLLNFYYEPKGVLDIKAVEKELFFMDSKLWWESRQAVDKYICKNNK